jgi:hypothetical protein
VHHALRSLESRLEKAEVLLLAILAGTSEIALLAEIVELLAMAAICWRFVFRYEPFDPDFARDQCGRGRAGDE